MKFDPDSLTAAGNLGSHQGTHLARIDAYVAGVCGRTGAFSGVLNLFQGPYESALAAAHDGLRTSQAVAEKVRSSVHDTRDDFLATDRAAYDSFVRKYADLLDLPPYRPPGSGDSTYGTGAAPPEVPSDPVEDYDGLTAADYQDGIVDRVMPESAEEEPDDPKVPAGRKHDLADGLGTLDAAWSAGDDVRGSFTDLVAGSQELGDTLDDVSDYNDFEAGDHGDPLELWGTR